MIGQCQNQYWLDTSGYMLCIKEYHSSDCEKIGTSLHRKKNQAIMLKYHMLLKNTKWLVQTNIIIFHTKGLLVPATPLIARWASNTCKTQTMVESIKLPYLSWTNIMPRLEARKSYRRFLPRFSSSHALSLKQPIIIWIVSYII